MRTKDSLIEAFFLIAFFVIGFALSPPYLEHTMVWLGANPSWAAKFVFEWSTHWWLIWALTCAFLLVCLSFTIYFMRRRHVDNRRYSTDFELRTKQEAQPDQSNTDISASKEMKYRKCPICAELILEDAAKCRFCGEPLKSHSRRKKTFIAVAGTIIFCMIVGIIGFIASSTINTNFSGIKETSPYGNRVGCYLQEDSSFYKPKEHLFEEPECFIDRDKGFITIMFDFNIPLANQAPDKFPNEVCVWYSHILIKMFDNNGQYINHFTTAETYGTIVSKYILRHLKDYVGLKRTGNVLQYPINLRDAAFIKHVEFGPASQITGGCGSKDMIEN